MKKILSSIILVSGAMTAGFASAGTGDIAVSYNKESLGSPVGREMVYERLHSAAQRACGSVNYREVGSVSQVRENRACVDSTVDELVAQVNNKGLSALHNGYASVAGR